MPILLLSGITALFALVCIRLWRSQKIRHPKIKPEPLFDLKNPTHILFSDKPPLLGGTPRLIPLKKFEKKENIIWTNSPVAYANTLKFLSITPQRYDKYFMAEYIGDYNDFVICEMDPMVGKGVFTTKPIKNRTVIGIYTGILELTELANPDYSIRAHNEKRTAFFYDAIRYRNATTYIQHAPDCGKPPIAKANLQIEDRIEGGITLSLYVAKRDIEANEQLLVNYGRKYWEDSAYYLFDKKGQIIP
ncbi:MAG TPA: SET domain-containing protein-lysine N-methyltransferase [Gammaproteobacteria bacterium]|nr:SET domain-containing protein-lysine N-methyltransferase [Gammaproteobacteria bacterium]